MKFRIIFVLVLLLVNQTKGLATSPDSSVIRVFTLIYNQKFDEAENALEINKLEINAFYFQILNIDLHWWKYSMSRSKEDAANLRKVLDDNNEADLDTTSQHIIHLIKTSYRFRYEVKRFNIIEALFLRSDIQEQTQQMKNSDWKIGAEEQKLFDLYIVLLDYSYNSVNPFFSKTKSEVCETSLAKIESYTLYNDLIVQTLAHYFLGRIYMKVENEPEKAKAQFQILSEEYPQNPYFAELAANL